ncbi:spore germination protein [Priestia koreensis]|uniref:spore germination protein n=1 Tax=Priestia koreensis TaxID=284581 RepID=UPI001F584ECC|nr:spore germination protein [Priestia koreensis]MCM3005089.1 spore germination protein [Priestia koreensis]UNL83078.1 spore germination protein [Priestia koreensis]
MPSFFKHSKPKKERVSEQAEETSSSSDDHLFSSLSENVHYIQQKTGNSPDIVIRQLSIGDTTTIQSAIVYVDGMVDEKAIQDFLLESMMKDDDLNQKVTNANVLSLIKKDILAFGDVSMATSWEDFFLSLMSGDTMILVDGHLQCIVIDTKGGERRAISEPSSQMVVRGSKEGFNETLATNISLVRRIIKNPSLWVESMKIGNVTKTDVAIMYIDGIANEKIVKEVKDRLKRINIDSILESGYIEQLIEDKTFTTFPTIYHTERPDTVAGNLLEGRIAIFVDGTPFVLVAPAVFIQFFQSAEDYYARFDIASSLRFLRVMIFFISLIAPATYVAITTFHQEMVPTKLIVAIAAQREAIPFPAFVEAILMEVTFEILREAGLRLPKTIGSAVSIVGALVIGQSAVQAGIVSPAMVIVVAITAIASFATPSFAIAISARLLRFLFMVSAATFGFYGIILSLLIMVVHLSSLRSFGVPYMAPLAPFILSDAGDTAIRLPWWSLRKRPRLIADKNITREAVDQGPDVPASRGIVNQKAEDGDHRET